LTDDPDDLDVELQNSKLYYQKNYCK